MKKYIFFDIDGTLFARNGKMPESAGDTLGRLKEKGHEIFLCSGRSKTEIPESLLAVGFDGMVASAGAYVEYRGKALSHRPIPQELVEELMKFLYRRTPDLLLETNEGAYLTADTLERIKNQVEQDVYLSREARDEFYAIFTVREDLWKVRNVNKLLYFSADDTAEEIEEAFGNKFIVLPSSIAWNGKNSGEISEAGMTKAVGMQCLDRHLSMGRENIIAVGDGLNDMEMLEYAGIGIAMDTGDSRLKEVADLITDSPENNGIRNAFHTLKLLE